MKIEINYKELTPTETIERLKEMVGTQQPYRHNDETIYNAINYLNAMKIKVESKVKENEKINCKTTKCENCINHNYCDFESKTGHWIDKSHQSGCGVIFYRVECSKCGKASGLSHTLANYCPNCGAEMAESEDK